VRLAHISFFGLGILNLCLLWTFHHTGITTGIQWPSNLMVIGAITMPLVCYLSAWKMACRYLFPIPAGSVFLAILLVLWRLATRP